MSDIKILIIEDEISLLSKIEENLKKANFTTISATSGNEALKIIEREKIDGIILDVALPDMDGWELCSNIKAKFPSLPVIIVFLATPRDEKKFIDLKLKYCWNKPEDYVFLTGMLREIFPPVKILKKDSITLLVVEDDKVILNIVKTLFELEGYKVFSALNPYIALSLLEENNYKVNLIMTDVSMPKMDGISFYLKLKEKKVTKDIPVIMLTSKGQFEDIKVAYDIGVREYVQKPFDPVELLQKVEEVLTVNDNKYYEGYEE